ncbi:MAG TPA: tetraacyldisaccharide 4'-kinase [Nitrobacter sp.]|nr:tetraacyldisaccharide 4'-kinase [Nitrobacter sp.]
MHEPGFWHRPSSLLSRVLAPLGTIYGAVSGWRMMRSGVRAGVPVICVGNYHAGGAGKTPTVLALAKLLGAMGESPVVLSRGYGGRLAGPVVVDPAHHAAADVGDEPLMMARSLPVIVARDRAMALPLVRSSAASVILMDDGLQNPAIMKDASVVVIDGDRGIGNGRVFPAGPLRAPLPLQIARTDALVVIGDGNAADSVVAAVNANGGSTVRGRFKANEEMLARLRGVRVFAFAGIGDPDRFFRTLRANGIDVAMSTAFPDHHAFSRSEIDGLITQAENRGLTLVTTEKDLVRLGDRTQFGAAVDTIVPFAVTLEIDDGERLRRLLGGCLRAARESDQPAVFSSPG